MGRKIFFIVLIFVIVIGSFLFYFKYSKDLYSLLDLSQSERTNEINFYLWEDYIPQSIFDDFEEKYGIKVIPTYFIDESESKKEILKNPDKYDLYIASNFLTTDLIKRDFLEEIKINKLVLNSIEEEYWGLSQSFNSNYFVPFSYGATGVIYNKNYFIDSPTFEDFFDIDYSNKRGVLTDLDIVFYILFEYSGSSKEFISSNDYYQMNEFFDIQYNSTYFGDYNLLLNLLENESILFATVYGAEFFLNKEKMINFNYSIDPIGLVWSDYFVVPKNSKNKKNVELLIEFILTKENAAKIMDYSYCIVPVKESIDLVENEEVLEYKKLISNSNISPFIIKDEGISLDQLKDKIYLSFFGRENDSI